MGKRENSAHLSGRTTSCLSFQRKWTVSLQNLRNSFNKQDDLQGANEQTAKQNLHVITYTLVKTSIEILRQAIECPNPGLYCDWP